MNRDFRTSLLAILAGFIIALCLTTSPAFADYDDEDSDESSSCEGRHCQDTHDNSVTATGGRGGRGGEGGEGGEGGDGFGLGIGIGKGGTGYGGDGGSVGDITVEGDKTRVSNENDIYIGGDKTRVEQDNDQSQYQGTYVGGDKIKVEGDGPVTQTQQVGPVTQETGPVSNDTEVTSYFDLDGPSVTVEGASLTNEMYWEAADVRSAAIEEGKALVRYGETHAETAPRPARAMANGCDTGGFTVQTGIAGGGNSAPTFPCEVARTQQVKDDLPPGFFNQGVLRFLMNGRLVFKGLTSWIPIIGN